MGDNLRELIEKLSQVLGEVIQDSDRVRSLLQQIEKEGYASHLTLAIVLGLDDDPSNVRKIVYRTKGEQHKGKEKASVRRLSAFDKRFLRALRIQIPD